VHPIFRQVFLVHEMFVDVVIKPVHGPHSFVLYFFVKWIFLLHELKKCGSNHKCLTKHIYVCDLFCNEFKRERDNTHVTRNWTQLLQLHPQSGLCRSKKCFCENQCYRHGSKLLLYVTDEQFVWSRWYNLSE